MPDTPSVFKMCDLLAQSRRISWAVERCRGLAPLMRRKTPNPSVSLGLARNQIRNRAPPPLCGPYREVE